MKHALRSFIAQLILLTLATGPAFADDIIGTLLHNLQAAANQPQQSNPRLIDQLPPGSQPDSIFNTPASQNSGLVDSDPTAPSREVESGDPQITALAAQLTQGLNSKYDQARAIHDWVAGNIKYAWSAYRDGSYVNLPLDAVSVLQSKTAVCFGYSNLFAALARAAQIPTRVIIGQICYKGTDCSENGKGWIDHAWDESLLVNPQTPDAPARWVEIDTTWDAPYDPDGTGENTEIREKYFDPSLKIFEKDHRPKTEPTNPAPNA